jgi:hypothetical protein
MIKNAEPQLFESQVLCRLALAQKRTTQYPLDSLDFILLCSATSSSEDN